RTAILQPVSALKLVFDGISLVIGVRWYYLIRKKAAKVVYKIQMGSKVIDIPEWLGNLYIVVVDYLTKSLHPRDAMLSGANSLLQTALEDRQDVGGLKRIIYTNYVLESTSLSQMYGDNVAQLKIIHQK
ncbi:unnamed protein product, partial [Adineta steineri]